MSAPRNPGPRLAVDAVILHADKVLLIERGGAPFAGSWALPGGFVDAGESVEAACVREALEETGLRIELTGLLGVYSHPERDPRGHVVSVVHLARPAPGADASAIQGGDDAARAAWHPLAALPALAFDHARILHDMQERLLA